jgi:hypothetical protein
MTMTTDWSALIEAAVADVEAGVKRNCKMTRACVEMAGCPKCGQGLMKGDIGILAIDVYKSGTLRLTTVHDGKPCTVAFRNVSVTVHDSGTGDEDSSD